MPKYIIPSKRDAETLGLREFVTKGLPIELQIGETDIPFIVQGSNHLLYDAAVKVYGAYRIPLAEFAKELAGKTFVLSHNVKLGKIISAVMAQLWREQSKPVIVKMTAIGTLIALKENEHDLDEDSSTQ